MSGHSKWETTKRQKGANDVKRGALFTRLSNQIAIAARGGADPSMNPALALAIDKAKAANMPNSNIDRAVSRASDKSLADLEEETYEAIGPGGVGLIIEIATDNKNRTYPEVKNILSKNGSRIADPGSVMFQFKRRGVIEVDAIGEDALLQVLDAGAEDAKEEHDHIIVYTDPKDLSKVNNNIKAAGLNTQNVELAYIANNVINDLPEEKVHQLNKLLDMLDDISEVSNIFTNVEPDLLDEDMED